jgi:septal ring factor EnvC (AmiA/AmiB activator)
MYWTTPSIYAADLYTAQMLQQQQMSMLQQQQMSVQQASQHLLRQAQAAQEQHQLWLAQTQADAHHHEAYQRMIDADRARSREELARVEQARAQAARNRESAERRAQELLMEHLTEAQRKTIKDHGWFVVEGGRSKKLYRIRTSGVAGNIDELYKEKVTHRLCCHLDHAIPRYDHYLAQKLALELDEARFLNTANRHAA